MHDLLLLSCQEVNIWWLPDSIERVFYCKWQTTQHQPQPAASYSSCHTLYFCLPPALTITVGQRIAH